MSSQGTLEVRTLRTGEEERVLDLLDGWPFRDGRSGREFFRRPIDHDPRYEARNFLVAEEHGELVSCVQIFPRWLRVRGQPVPTGGIGSVFTAERARCRGLAERLLVEAMRQMEQRGFELSLLWASRVGWYSKLGWRLWGGETYDLTLRDDAPPSPARTRLEIERFDAAVHLAAVMELAELYSMGRAGTVVRNREDWRANLELAGDPHEEFLVVREEGSMQLSAFLRGTVIGGSWCATEWAHDASEQSALGERGSGASHLALLVATTLRALGLPSLRFPRLRDPLLEQELQRLGVGPLSSGSDGGSAPREDARSFWMLRAVAPEELARRFELPWEGRDCDEEHERLLEQLLPRHEFNFWPADRF